MATPNRNTRPNAFERKNDRSTFPKPAAAPIPRSKSKVEKKNTFSTIYKNPMLNISKVQKIPVNPFSRPEKLFQSVANVDTDADVADEVEELRDFLYSRKTSSQDSIASIAEEVTATESLKAVEKRSSKKLVTDPDFNRMPAEDVVRYLQKEERLSFVPSTKNVTARKPKQKVSAESRKKDNFISSPPSGNPFHDTTSKQEAQPLPQSRARKIEVPWRRFSAFTSPTAQRQQIFQNFHKTSPDPPRSPSPPPPLESNSTIGDESQAYSNIYRPSQLTMKSLEAKYMALTPAEKAKSLQALRESKLKERQQRNHIAQRSSTVIAQGREMGVLSKSINNGLTSIGKGRKQLNEPQVYPVDSEEGYRPRHMEGVRRKGAANNNSDKRGDPIRKKHESFSTEGFARQVYGNVFVGRYVGPDSTDQLQYHHR